MYSFINFIFFFNILLLLHSVKAYSCKDEQNNDVDWSIMYKFHKSFKYMYLLPSSNSFSVSKNTIDQGGILKYTYNQIFDNLNDSTSIYGIYNDETPNNPNGEGFGHLKGSFLFKENQQGFWIIHSVPRLPDSNTAYIYPDSAERYGQHVLCVTLNYADLELIEKQLSFARPQFQKAFLPKQLRSKFTVLERMFRNKIIKQKAVFNIGELKTIGTHMKMIHFSKAKKFGKDLYSKFVAPVLRTSLLTETWQHGEAEDSDCSQPYQVNNIKYIQFPGSQDNFPSTDDHAKWAISINSKEKVVCLGDINRMTSQFHRGGGTMCLFNNIVWNSFSSLISSIEGCKTTPAIKK